MSRKYFDLAITFGRSDQAVMALAPVPEPTPLGRLLIVSDKSADRAALIQLCRANDVADDLQMVETGSAALQRIRSSPPDVVLLECELSDMSGFEVLSSLDHNERPTSIMIARDERFAIQAFESAAIDYLTKPISPLRFNVAVGRARELLLAKVAKSIQHDVLAMIYEKLAGASSALAPTRRLVGERAHRLHFLALELIDYIESDGNYVSIHVGDHAYTSRDTVKRLASTLSGAGFERIRRDILINMGRVAFAERLGQAKLVFTMTSGARLTSRLGYRLELVSSLRPQANSLVPRDRGAQH